MNIVSFTKDINEQVRTTVSQIKNCSRLHMLSSFRQLVLSGYELLNATMCTIRISKNCFYKTKSIFNHTFAPTNF